MITMEMLMASSVRANNYTKLVQEADLEKEDDAQLKKVNWPNQGEVDFTNIYMKYGEQFDHVIRGLSVSIQAKEKIGCVGRTGAGKSSIIQLLFRMVEIDKSEPNMKNSAVVIDNKNTMDVGLHLLRNGISIIP